MTNIIKEFLIEKGLIPTKTECFRIHYNQAGIEYKVNGEIFHASIDGKILLKADKVEFFDNCYAIIKDKISEIFLNDGTFLIIDYSNVICIYKDRITYTDFNGSRHTDTINEILEKHNYRINHKR